MNSDVQYILDMPVAEWDHENNTITWNPTKL